MRRSRPRPPRRPKSRATADNSTAVSAAERELTEFAPAKVNLTLHVLGRRPDGYHEIESLVVFADVGDRLTLVPGTALELVVRGPTAEAAGATDGNLVLKAARALAERIKGLKVGRLKLEKELPVAAGLGGGSSDAAAALRLLARASNLSLADERVREAARLTGADVPVCLDLQSRMMHGIGEILSPPLALPMLPAVLVNPGVAVATRDVFAALAAPPLASPPKPDDLNSAGLHTTALVSAIAQHRNDLEGPAIRLRPVIAKVLAALRELQECRLARMSGSGATCFALFDSAKAAAAAARVLRGREPDWWVRSTMLG
jgi:4-diphosphocytidyl-2-C-methyl-D-erythritol kinase